MVDLFLNRTDFSCSNKASRNLLSSPVELGSCIGLSPLVTWVSVLVQAKFCLTLMVICLSTSPSCHTLCNCRICWRSKTWQGKSWARLQVLWHNCVTALQSVSWYWQQAFSVLVTCYVRTGSWCSWALAGGATGGVEFASLGVLIGLDYSQWNLWPATLDCKRVLLNWSSVTSFCCSKQS